jgi:type IV pilus assembly protein PilV
MIPVRYRYRQMGASLIEVLVAVLLLSFGMLALGSMMAFGVQSPKLSAYRATAANLAAGHVERIRANPGGFGNPSGTNTDSYTMNMSYDGNFYDATTDLPALVNCAYPACTESTLATMDKAATNRAVRIELPAGGMVMKCDTSPCTKASYGNLWILWQEPSTVAVLGASSDNCPTAETGWSALNPKPRCLYVRFKIE